jgi:hypothetical protein
MNPAPRFRIEFAVHIASGYRTNYLAELYESFGANSFELPDGAVEMYGFKPNQAAFILDALRQEQSRGALIILHAS